MVAFRIAFLMPHQDVSPDLEVEAMSLYPAGKDNTLNKESPEYLAGAHDALLSLIRMLEGKGPQIKE